MDAFENSFARHSLKIGSASFNSRNVSSKMPRNDNADTDVPSCDGVSRDNGKSRDSDNGRQTFESSRRQESSVSFSRNEEPSSLTIGELLKTNKRQLENSTWSRKFVDLDAKVAVDIEHYDQWARTRRPEPNSSSSKPYTAQIKDSGVKKDSNGQMTQQKQERPRPKSVHGIHVQEERVKGEVIPGSSGTVVSSDIPQEIKDLKEGSNDTFHDGDRLSRLIAWNSKPKITRNVLKELHATCAAIIKDVERGSCESYNRLNSDKDSDKRTTSPEKICDSERVPVIKTGGDSLENAHDISLSIRKLPVIFRNEESEVKNYRHTLYQSQDQHKIVTLNTEVTKSSASSRESSRNYMQYKMQMPVSKREPFLPDNKNLALDFRSKRIENLWKLCEKPAKHRSNSKITLKHKPWIKRQFHNNPSSPLSLESFLNRSTNNNCHHDEIVDWNELLTLQNNSSFRFSMNNSEKTSTVVRGGSKVVNACF